MKDAKGNPVPDSMALAWQLAHPFTNPSGNPRWQYWKDETVRTLGTDTAGHLIQLWRHIVFADGIMAMLLSDACMWEAYALEGATAGQLTAWLRTYRVEFHCAPTDVELVWQSRNPSVGTHFDAVRTFRSKMLEAIAAGDAHLAYFHASYAATHAMAILDYEL